MDCRIPHRSHLAVFGAAAATLALTSCNGSSGSAPPPQAQGKPNILFIVMDDMGVDQLTSYGYGGTVPPRTPNLAAIAQAGLQFRNAWSMPTCTPTRAAFFLGRYPSSTNILNAVVSTDLANSEMSPYEVTVPKLLKTQGYTSALIGKMHLTGTDLDGARNLPYGHQTMWKLGWDHFDGYLDGAPYPIDTRAGLANVPEGTYKCGFVPRASFPNGADTGACYQASGGCAELTAGADGTAPGRVCMERGGIFDPRQSCKTTRPGHVDFTKQNGYYTGEFVVSRADGSTRKVTATDPSARGYRSTLEADRAVAWVKEQAGGKPWMLSLGFSAAHTPLQLPPRSLVAPGTPGRDDPFICHPGSDPENAPTLDSLTNVIDAHLVTNMMLEAMDKEIGRLLVELGLATFNADGSLNYQPEKTNTVVVITGDNGTYVNSVKFSAPGRFDPTRSKGFPYQTGVWVPMIVAGPMVKQPGREVTHMVNATDLYQLFAELAGADVKANVPAARPVDAQPMLAYLTDPAQAAIRRTNFTEVGTNFTNPQAAAAPPQPCVVEAANTCVVIFPNKALCGDQGGIWYGADSGLPGVPAGGFSNCAQASSYRVAQGQTAAEVYPRSQKAASDGAHKLVRLYRENCPVTADYANAKCNGFKTTDELYAVDAATPNPLLDRAPGSAFPAAAVATATAEGAAAPALALPAGGPQQAYEALKAELDRRDAVAGYNRDYDAVHCPGDGNRDLVVDQKDLDNWQELSQLNGGQSSWYDLNHDGRTDAADRAIIQANFGRRCAPPG